MSSACERVFVSGANRGIGLEFVRRCLETGAVVTAACREPDEAADLRALRDEFGASLVVERLDVTSEESIAGLARRLAEARVRFDLLVSNAGVCEREGFGEWTMAALMDQLCVNVAGAALLCQALAPMLNEGGKVVQLGSRMGSLELNLNGAAPVDGYSISKAGLNMVTRRLANHLAERRVCVVSMSPGWVRTEMGGEQADLSVEDAVGAMLAAIGRLGLEDSGSFLGSDGCVVPW